MRRPMRRIYSCIPLDDYRQLQHEAAATRSAMYERGEPNILAEMIAEGRNLGLSETEMREGLEPPLSDAEWRESLARSHRNGTA